LTKNEGDVQWPDGSTVNQREPSRNALPSIARGDDRSGSELAAEGGMVVEAAIEGDGGQGFIRSGLAQSRCRVSSASASRPSSPTLTTGLLE